MKLRMLMANTIVAQLLPDGAVKGGTALKIRFGIQNTRYTTDLDTARTSDIETYIAALEDALESGWEGFTGKIVPKSPASPANVPKGYIMQPYEIKLSYLGKPWVTVSLEVGHNEIGGADVPDIFYPQEVSQVFDALDFPPVNPVRLLPLNCQIAQKLHGLSEPGSRRLRDLIDLQIIVDRSTNIDYADIHTVCKRLFKYRQRQEWPPTIVERVDWHTEYIEIAAGLPVRQKLKDAVDWVNGLIQNICRH